MNYINALENAVIYIEKNITQDISVAEVAKSTGYSYYHFTRLFEVILGESVGNYIRKRRLANAAKELLYSDRKIIEIALESRFESPEAFTRAFKKIYSISPRKYRKNRIDVFMGNKKELNLERIEHLIKHITIKPVITELPEIKVVGIREAATLQDNKLPELWNHFSESISRINNRTKEQRVYGICETERPANLYGENTVFSEVVGAEVMSFSDVPCDMIIKTIPKGRYAVFTHKGSLRELRKTYEYIWGTWILFSEFELDMRDDFEVYDETFLGVENQASEIKICIPIK